MADSHIVNGSNKVSSWIHYQELPIMLHEVFSLLLILILTTALTPFSSSFTDWSEHPNINSWLAKNIFPWVTALCSGHVTSTSFFHLNGIQQKDGSG